MLPLGGVPQAYSGQNPTPRQASIIFLAASGLSLSNIIFGSNPAAWQNLSQSTRSCFDPIRLMNPRSRISLRFTEFLSPYSGISGTAMKISSSMICASLSKSDSDDNFVVTLMSYS